MTFTGLRRSIVGHRRVHVILLTLLVAALVGPFLASPAAQAAGAVTDCSSYGAAGGLQSALAGGGTVTFQCSGTIVVPEIVVSSTVTLDSNGRAVVLSGGNANRVLQVTSGGNLTVKGLTVANGLAKGADGTGGSAQGGGIMVGGTATLINASVTNNQAAGASSTDPSDLVGGGSSFGGGISVESGTLTLLNSTVANNTSTGGNASGGSDEIQAGSGHGGGVFVDTNSSVTLTNSTIAGNHARGGNAGPSPTGNSHGGDATNAGIHVGRSTATLLNVTVVNNDAVAGVGGNANGLTSAGGLGVFAPASVTLTNSLIAKNVAGFGPDVANVASQINWQGYNLIGNTLNSNFSGDATNQTNVDPLLDPAGLQANGGPTSTVGLQSTSPALDKIPVASCPATDQRYGTRSGLCDVGAFERNATLPQVALNPVTLPDGTINQPYSQTLTPSGGTGPYSVFVSAGTLPPGLTLSSTGLLSGAPTTTGTTAFSVRAADTNGFTASRDYSLFIGAPTVVDRCTAGPPGQVSSTLAISYFPPNETLSGFIIDRADDGTNTVHNGFPITTDPTGTGTSQAFPGPATHPGSSRRAVIFRDTNANGRWDPDTDNALFQGTATLAANACQNVTYGPK